MPDPRDKWSRRASIALVLLAGPVIFFYTKATMAGQVPLYTACGLLASGGIFVGVRLHHPRRSRAWYLLAAGNLLFVVGDQIYWHLASIGHVPFPALNDVAYLAAYPLLAVGIAGLIGGPRRARGSFIDACIIATSAGLVGWTFLMEPYATDPSLTMGARLASIAYPVGDLLLLATVCWFLLSGGRRNTSLNLLLISTSALLICDTIWGVQVLQGTYEAGWTDAGFIISYLTFGAAGLHPSMRALVPKTEAERSTISRRRLVLLATAVILGPGLLGLTAVRGAEINIFVMTGGTLLLFLLTFMRIAGLVRSVERTASLLEVQGTELSSAIDDLKVLETARRNLLEAVHTASERERTSLAVDLHDGPIQHLTTLVFEVDLATLGLEQDDLALTSGSLQALETGLSTEIESLRILMTDLRPPVLDERGFSQALNDYGAALMLRQNIVCDFDLDIETRLDPEIESILYRIAQEALTNVAKHSRAGHVLVRCRARDGEFEMEVTDDGIGFDVSATDMSGMDGHLGLASIRERIEFAGGRCTIDSAVGGGTRVSVSLDLEGNRDAEIARIAS